MIDKLTDKHFSLLLWKVLIFGLIVGVVIGLMVSGKI